MATELQGNKLRKARKMAGLTQDELARLARIERSKISRAENGFLALGPSEAAAIERALLGVIRRRTARLGVLLGEQEKELVAVPA